MAGSQRVHGGSKEGSPRHGPRYEAAKEALEDQPRLGLSPYRLPVTRGDIEDLLAEGYGKGQVARALGISKSTLNRRLNERG
ncbi:MAG: hypothetical protein LN413_01070 [Candidatus Thermoplasmatota archaeon]|nr:hypothetical protein [Candidatus Thermoplasmatota archaeon]